MCVLAVRSYGGMEVNIHLFRLSEESSRFSRFTPKVSAARTDVMGPVGRGGSPDLGTGKSPTLLPALDAVSVSGRSYCKVFGDLQQRNCEQCRKVCLFIDVDSAP
jgi:hypothetical protein